MKIDPTKLPKGTVHELRVLSARVQALDRLGVRFQRTGIKALVRTVQYLETTAREGVKG